MGFLVAGGIVALFFGILFMVSPKNLEALSKSADRLVFRIDRFAYNNRIGIGICLVMSSLFLFFIAYYIKAKY